VVEREVKIFDQLSRCRRRSLGPERQGTSSAEPARTPPARAPEQAERVGQFGSALQIDAHVLVSSEQGCGCRKPCPCRSRRTFVLMKDAAQTITPTDVETGDRVRIGDRFG
jgi:hypothetical protein